jgi:cytoskeleton-associated protein 5
MKSPKVLAGCLLWMNQLLQEFGIIGGNLKKLIEFVKPYFENPAAPVRANAVAIVVTLYQLGKHEVRHLISDAPAGILSSLDTEISKAGEKRIIPLKFQNVNAPEVVEELVIPKTDLSSKISVELLQQMADMNWKERKAALEEFAKILDQTHGSIQPNLNSEIISGLKARIIDSNKNLCLIALDICGNISKFMGKPFERYVKVFISPILSLLADQKSTVRSVVISNLEKIVESVGLGSVLQSVGLVLTQDQPQIRKELLKWLSEKKTLLSSETAELNFLVGPIFICLQDRNSDVRKFSQSVLVIIAEVIDVSTLKSKASDSYHGSQLASILPFLDAINNTKVPDTFKATPKHLAPRSPPEQKKMKMSRPAVVKTGNCSSESLNTNNGTLLRVDLKGKEQRASQDRGVLKWIFDTPRRELVDLLSEQCLATFDPDLHALLFSSSHYKEKDILAGLKLLNSFFTDVNDFDKTMYFQIVTSNSDLILKYLTIRFCDTNTSIFIKCLELLENLLQILDDAGYLLNEYEASSFLPFFIGKMGEPKETMRIKLRSIIKQISRVYPVSKLFVYLMKGLDTKNSRTRTECLDELASLVQRNGQGVFVASKCVSIFANQVGDRDASVRNSALNLICQIHAVLGDDVNQFFSKISEKEKDLISERLKRQPGSNLKTSPVVANRAQPKRIPLPSRGATPVREKSHESRPLSPGLPVVKQFALDFDKLDMLIPSSNTSNIQTNSSTTKKPKIDFSTMNSYESASSVDDGLEARIGIITEQISSPDLDTNLDGARHLEKLLNAHSNNEIIRTVDIVGIIISVSQTAFSNLSTKEPLTLRLCKLYTSILVQIFSSNEASKFVPYSSMEQCARKVITYLVDPDLQNLDTTKSLPRALNMLLVKMIDNCETNSIFRYK